MKICIISAYPPQRGGIASYVEELVKEIAKKRKVIVLTYEKLGRKSTKNIEIREISLPKISWLRGLIFIFKSLVELRKLPKDVKIIHAHYLHPPGTVAIIFKKFFRKDCKVVITLHGSDITNLYRNKLYRFFLRKILKNANTITCVSEFLKRKVKESLNKEVIVTYTGLPKIKVRSSYSKIREKLKIKKNEIIVSYFGVLEKHKGIDVFINLAEKFSSKNVKFLIAGKGSWRKKIEKIAGKNENVFYLGSLSREEVLKYMKASDIIVVPSRREALGLTALEANYLGKAVIGLKTQGLKEVLSGIALAKNEKELENLIFKAINSKKFREKIIQENKKLLKKFSWKNTVRIFEKIYSEI